VYVDGGLSASHFDGCLLFRQAAPKHEHDSQALTSRESVDLIPKAEQRALRWATALVIFGLAQWRV
jgi:hypothetical protein